MPLFAETAPLASGTLPEADGHAVWWETFGDAACPAVLLLHGGPGGGTAPRMPASSAPRGQRPSVPTGDRPLTADPTRSRPTVPRGGAWGRAA